MKATILLIALFAACILAEDKVTCGATVSTQDVKSICAQYAGWNQSDCECVVTAASKGNANNVHLNADGSYEVGLFAINSAMWGVCNGGKAPCAVTENLNCAIDLYKMADSNFGLFANCAMSCTACNADVTAKKPTHTTSTHATGTHATHATHATPTVVVTTYSDDFNNKPKGGEGAIPQQAKNFDF